MKPKKPTKLEQIKTLERKLLETEAQLLSTKIAALQNIKKVGTDHLMASAAVITITALGGRLTIGPFSITDGLSPDTIAAIEADLHRSIDYSTSWIPKKEQQP